MPPSALIAGIVAALVAAVVLGVVVRKKLRVAKEGDTLVIEVDDRRPRVAKHGARVTIEFDRQRIEIPPDWSLAPPEIVVTRWRTPGAGAAPQDYLSISAGERELYRGTRANGELVLAELRKYVK